MVEIKITVPQETAKLMAGFENIYTKTQLVGMITNTIAGIFEPYDLQIKVLSIGEEL